MPTRTSRGFSLPESPARTTERPVEERVLTLIAWGTIAIGVLVRALLLLEERALWVDEAMLSVNIAARSFANLLGVLDFRQSAPPGFLWTEKLAALATDATSETAWRLFPFCSSIAILIVLWFVTRRVMSTPVATVVTAIASLSPLFIRYAVELKPYSSDALTTMLIVAATIPLLRAPESVTMWVRLGTVGIFALVFSQFAIFALAGAGLALCVDPGVRRARRWFPRALLLGAIWLACFGFEYVTIIGPSAASMREIGYWDTAFLTPGAPDLGERWKRALHFIFASPVREFAFSWPSLAVILGVFALGIASLIRERRWAIATLIAIPIALTVLAAMAGLFPPSRRLVLFIAPLVLLGYGAAVQVFFDRLRPLVASGLATAMVVALLVWQRPVLAGWDESAIAPNEPSRTVIEYARSRGDSEPLYIFTTALPAWIHYTTDWRAPDESRLEWIRTITGPGGDAFWLRPPRGKPVTGEGSDLIREVDGRRELIGVPPGQPRTSTWEESDSWHPDPGWADNEALRIRSVSRPYGWLLAWHYTDREMRELLAALRRQCATFVGGMREGNALAYRLRFDPPGCLLRTTWPSEAR